MSIKESQQVSDQSRRAGQRRHSFDAKSDRNSQRDVIEDMMAHSPSKGILEERKKVPQETLALPFGVSKRHTRYVMKYDAINSNSNESREERAGQGRPPDRHKASKRTPTKQGSRRPNVISLSRQSQSHQPDSDFYSQRSQLKQDVSASLS